ncbi:MAG: PilW family protein [Bdellovibrionales bacterium]|nr:PilW family protein [Ramlibacter sp.]
MSLIELMVAITVGLILVAGLATLFANSSQSGNELDKSIRQMENGRYAVELVTEDISVAGFYGELPIEGVAWSAPDPCATALASLGWDNATSAVPLYVTGLTAAQAGALTCLPNYKVGTAALILRRLDTTAVAASSTASSSAYVQTSRCVSDPNATRFIVSSTASDFTLRDLNCTAITQVRRYVSRIYYVASCNECGVDTIPTLKRAEVYSGGMAVAPLSEGIDEVAFEYGFDTDGDGVPDVYRAGLSGVAAAADNDWSNVVATRMHVMSRSTETSPGYTDGKTYSLGLAGTRGPFTDNFKRRVYSATARLNNPGGLREAP